MDHFRKCNGPQSDVYDKLKTASSKGYKYLGDALELEEKAKATGTKVNYVRVMEYYRRGIDEIEKALLLDLSKIASDRRQRAIDLKLKMRKNCEEAKTRLAELEYPANTLPNSGRATARSKTAPCTIKTATNPTPRANIKPRTRTQSPLVNIPKKVANSDNAHATLAERAKKVKGVDAKLACMILDNVLELNPTTRFDEVAGLESAKMALHEAVILPAQNPDIFTGLRAPVQGILLFGPPGNGKTLLAKAVAAEAGCTFFNISASALTSKWVGEAEKLVKALFAMARQLQPAVIFLDEVDSILCERSEKDNEASRRLKTEFLLQFDGVGSDCGDRILVMAATNRPFELDGAVIRRFPKRIYIGLPDYHNRKHLLQHLLNDQLSSLDLDEVCRNTEGYSGSDLTHLAKEAAMGPVREIPPSRVKGLKPSQIRAINGRDFAAAIGKIRPSADEKIIQRLLQFNSQFGELI